MNGMPFFLFFSEAIMSRCVPSNKYIKVLYLVKKKKERERDGVEVTVGEIDFKSALNFVLCTIQTQYTACKKYQSTCPEYVHVQYDT